MNNYVPFQRSENTAPCHSRLYQNGTRVIGRRRGTAGHGKHGVVLYSYYTINDNDYYGIFKNQAFGILCDDGKERSYQYVDKE